MALLITPSLIGAYDWFMTAPNVVNKKTGNTWKHDAYQGLLDVLGRDYKPPSIEIQRGIDFEKTINSCISSVTPEDIEKYSLNVQKIINICKGGKQQKVSKSFIKVNCNFGEVELLLYGKIDFDKLEEIIDLKTTGEYKGQSRYLDTYQHRIYCYNEDKKNFRYVIAVMEVASETPKVKEVHEVTYQMEDREKLKSEIKGKCISMLNFFSLHSELEYLYFNKFCLYN